MKYQISFTEEFESQLHQTNSTLAVSIYQAGKILLINTDKEGSFKMTPISYSKPMGITSENEKLAITTKTELHLYANSAELASGIKTANGELDHLYLPRVTYHTGDLDLHDIAYVNGRITAVNTRYSCICQFDENHNFTPIWSPPFITQNTPEDRCHLNGMELENGKLKYITALGSGDYKDSWRENITESGILMDIPANKVVLDGLAMPHSPRLHNGKLYLLESAKGELVEIDPETYAKRTIVKLKGLVRGLAIHNNLAFIGISKLREGSTTFGKLGDDVKAENASIHIVDIKHSAILGVLNFGGSIEELYDIRILPNKKNIGVLGLYDERHKEAVTTPDNVFWKASKEETESKG